MIHNNTTVADSGDGSSTPWVAIYSLRLAGSLAIVSNIFVLLCALRLRRKFRGRDYWIQIVILAAIDIFNGIISLLLSFLIFDTNYIWCGFLLCLYMFAQINTLCAICCICVNRYRCLRNMDKTGGGIKCRQELGVAALSGVSLVYCTSPYFIWDLVQFEHEHCTAPVLFGLNNGQYLLHTSTGVFVPLIIINILYSGCVYKLWKSKNSIAPENSAHLSKHNKDTVPRTNKQNCNETYILTEQTVKPAEYLNKPSISGLSCSQDTSQTGTSTNASTKQVRLNGPQEQSSALGTRHIFKTRRDAQCRAIKLLGIVLILADVATIIPFSVLLRQGITSITTGTVSKKGSGNSIGVTCLSINALVDAFVYGLYSREIRKYLKDKLSGLWEAILKRL